MYMIKSNCFLSVFQSVFLFCFTLARTNHLLWTDPEVEPEGGPEVEPDGGPEVESDGGPEVEPDGGPEVEPDRGPDVAASPGGHLDLGVTVTTLNR